MYLTVFFSKGTVVPPDCTLEQNATEDCKMTFTHLPPSFVILKLWLLDPLIKILFRTHCDQDYQSAAFLVLLHKIFGSSPDITQVFWRLASFEELRNLLHTADTVTMVQWH